MTEYSWEYKLEPGWDSSKHSLFIGAFLFAIGIFIFFYTISNYHYFEYWPLFFPFIFFGGVMTVKSFRFLKDHQTPTQFKLSSEGIEVIYTKTRKSNSWEDILGWTPYSEIATSYYNRVGINTLASQVIKNLGKTFFKNADFIVLPIKNSKKEYLLMCTPEQFEKIVQVLNKYISPISVESYWVNKK